MSEKEFLIKFIKYCNDSPWMPEHITERFLEQHHKEYYEVEFVKIETTQEELIQNEMGTEN